MPEKPTYEELELRVRELEKSESDHKKTELKLFEVESNLRALLDAVLDTLFLMKPDGTILVANDGLAKSMGMPVSELIGKKASELVSNELEAERRVALDQALNTGEPVTFNDSLSGNIIESRFFPIKNAQGKVTHVAIFARDITKQKQAVEALRESEARFRDLAEMLPGAVFESDLDLRLTFVSQYAYKMFGYSRQDFKNGINCLEMLAPKDRKKAMENFALRLQKIEFGASEYMAQRKDCSLFPVLMHANIIYENDNAIGLRGILMDISHKKKMEEHLIESQKMESIGTLAGGIAHDFNNILSPIMAHAELALMDLMQDDPMQHSMKEIYDAGTRAKDLVNQILTFARKGPKKRIVVKSSLIIKEAVNFLRSSIPTTIDIQYNIKAEQDMVLADTTQLNQIIMNLGANSAHAMKEKGGLLEVILDNENISTSKVDSFSNILPGRYLKLSVRDNGKGISPDDIERIFDPYFTTRQVDEGTGLGLAIVHGIVQNHGGDIKVESKVGQGTTFHIYLPLVNKKYPDDAKQKIEYPKGIERILIIDDEKATVDVLKEMLEKLGYKITARTSSIEALEVFQGDISAFDLVITDMTMPKMTGEDLAKEIIAANPEVPVILCTGFSDKINEEKAKEIGISSFVMKPVVMSELAKMIRDVLDNRSQTR